MLDSDNRENEVEANRLNIGSPQNQTKESKFTNDVKANIQIDKKNYEINNDIFKSTENINENLAEIQKNISVQEDNHSDFQNYHKLKKLRIHRRRQGG